MSSGRGSRHVGTVGLYSASIVVSAIVTLLSIPILISIAGAHAWSGLAAAQSIGTGASVLIGFGWGTTGPTDVARSSAEQRRRLYRESYAARLVLALPVVTFACLITYAVTPAAQWESVLNCLAYACTGLLAGWFFTGAAQPVAFVTLDTAPRVLGAAVGVLAVAFGGPLILYPVLQFVGIAVGVAASTGVIAGRTALLAPVVLLDVIATLRRQSHGFVLAAVSATNAALPSILIAWLAPSALPAYALSDKLLRFGTTAAAPFVQFLQGWVPGGGNQRITSRARRAGLVGLGLVVVGATGFFLIVPWLARTLSQGQIELPVDLLAVFTLVLVLLVGAQVVGLVCLLALGESRLLARFTLIGGIAAVPLVALGAVVFGAVGAAAGVAVGELVAFVPQIVLLSKRLRRT